MKMVHPLFVNAIDIGAGMVNLLVIEDKKYYLRFINDLYNQINFNDTSFVFSEGDNNIDAGKCLNLILDIFALTVNNRKAITKIYSELAAEAQESEYYMKTQELLAKIAEYMAEILPSQKNALTFNEKLDISSIFKLTEVKFVEERDSILEKIIDYMEVMTNYCGIKCFFFVNLKSFFDENQLNLFYKDVIYRKYMVVLLENTCAFYNEMERRVVLDSDLCEI